MKFRLDCTVIYGCAGECCYASSDFETEDFDSLKECLFDHLVCEQNKESRIEWFSFFIDDDLVFSWSRPDNNRLDVFYHRFRVCKVSVSLFDLVHSMEMYCTMPMEYE